MRVLDITKIEPSKVSRNPEDKTILLHSKPKIGKTTFMSKIPKNLIIGFEHGTRLLGGIKAVEIDKWSEFKQIVKQLTTDPEARELYDSVTIDTISRAWDVCTDFIVSQGKDKNGLRAKSLSDIPWGRGYMMRDQEFISTLSSIEAAGYGLKFITHSEVEVLKPDEKTVVEVIKPLLPDRQAVRTYLDGTIDITMYIDYYINSEGEEVRELVTRSTENIVAGNRVAKLPTRIPLSYPAFCKALEEAIEKEDSENLTDELEVQEVVAKRSYDVVIEDAKRLWLELSDKDKEVTLDYIQGIYSEPLAISEIPESDIEILELVITEMESLLE